MRSRQQSSGEAPETTDSEFELTASAERAEDGQDEVEEMEVAAQLLEITNESELDQFIGGLLQKAARKIGTAIPASVLRPLANSLKGALKHTLPIVGSSSGAALASSGADAAARTLAAADAFGLELEGLSVEDQEFELARRFVRLTRAAGRRAPRFARRVPPRIAVRRTLVTAARRYAPGLLRRRRRNRRRYVAYRRPRYTRPAPVMYTDPEPIFDPASVVVAPAPAPEPEPQPGPDPDVDTTANGDAGGVADGDTGTDATAAADTEPAAEEISAASKSCRCGGRCGGSRARSGTWVREGSHIILRDA